MSVKQRIPFATIIIALLITIIQIFRILGGPYENFLAYNLHTGNWEWYYNQPWRIITSSFMHHHDILHYLGNLVTLCLFGWKIERSLGRTILLIAFFGAMVTAYVVWVNVMNGWLIGISGGVCGLFGLSLIANRRVPWWTTLTHSPLHLFYFLFLVAPLFPFFANMVDFRVAHLVHLVATLFGMLVGWAFLLSPRWRWIPITIPLVLFASPLYSPWKLEWRLVHTQPVLNSPVADCRTRTIDENTPAVINFVNSMDKPVAIYWMNLDGHINFAHVLNPGETIGYGTVITRAWCIVDLDSKEALQSIIVTEPEQTITIGE